MSFNLPWEVMELPPQEVFMKCVCITQTDIVSGHGRSDELTVGLDNLSVFFQPQCFYDSLWSLQFCFVLFSVEMGNFLDFFIFPCKNIC